MKIKFRIIVKNHRHFLKIYYNGPIDTVELRNHTQVINQITIPTTHMVLLDEDYQKLDIYMHQKPLYSLNQVIHIYMNDTTFNKMMFEDMVEQLKERVSKNNG